MSAQGSNHDSNESIKEEIGRYALPPIVSVACATILEDAIDELVILSKIGEFGKVTAEYQYKSAEERCSTYLPESQLYDPETTDVYENAMLRERYLKFQRDRLYIENILGDTLTSLVKNNDFGCLKNCVDQYYANLMFEDEVFHSYKVNQEVFNSLEDVFDQERVQNKAQLQELSQTVGNLKDKLEDLIVENKIKFNYIKQWEESRLEQNNLQLDYAEGAYAKIIDKYKTEIEKEMRIHSEIETYVLDIQQDHLQQIQQWMERYDNEIEIRDTEIQMLKEKREDQFNRLYELSQIYEKHREEINMCIEMKEQKRIEDELRQKRERAAIKIQAWWRGTMVRKCLGPYRKVKKGAQGSKGKGKGKGKK